MSLNIYYIKGDAVEKSKAAAVAELIPFLDAENRVRIRKKSSRALVQSLLAHGLSLYALAAQGEGDLLVHRDSLGMPYLTKPDGERAGTYLSCTHTDWIAAAAVCDKALGIDLEAVRHFNKMLARRMFTHTEYSWIEMMQDPNLAFTQVWTLREAYGKMLGTGVLRMPKVGLIADGTPAYCTDKSCTAWSGRLDEFVAAVVQKGKAEPVFAENFHRVSMAELENFLRNS